MRKQYGHTTPTCFFCGEIATTKNKDGVEVCKYCKDKRGYLCPIHNIPLDVKKGKYGSFFYCWKCDRIWSKSKVIKEEKENPETFSDKLLDKIRGN